MNSSKLTVECRSVSKEYRLKKYKKSNESFLKRQLFRESKKINALENVSFSIESGETVGYIGLNGAGKSTTIKMLSGIFPPTSGDINVFGNDPYKCRTQNNHNIGVIFGQRVSLSWHIPAYDSFKFLQKVYGLSDEFFQQSLDELTSILDVKELLHQPIRTLSLGQRMRMEIVSCLLHRPRLLLLDEPTIGLDILSKNKITTFFKTYAIKNNASVMITSHDIAEIEKMCERIIILDKGKILFDGLTDHFLSNMSNGMNIEIVFSRPIEEIYIPNLEIIKTQKNHFQWNFKIKSERDLPFLLQELNKYSRVKSIKILGTSLEESLLKLAQQAKG